MSDRCKRCPARIIWARTVNDKPIPVDEAEDSKGNIVLVQVGDGVRSYVVRSDADFPGEPRHMPHHATCPAAASFRKTKERRA